MGSKKMYPTSVGIERDREREVEIKRAKERGLI